MDREMIRLAADVPKGSVLHKGIQQEQDMTGRSVADIIRDSLVDRYKDAMLKAQGVGVAYLRNGKEAKNED